MYLQNASPLPILFMPHLLLYARKGESFKDIKFVSYVISYQFFNAITYLHFNFILMGIHLDAYCHSLDMNCLPGKGLRVKAWS